MELSDKASRPPVVPFIRESNFAPRKPWHYPERRLLDYLLVYIQEGQCRFRVDGTDYDFGAGEFCLVQPNSLVDLEGLTDTKTPFAHFDVFYTPDRERSFPTRPGQTDLTAYRDLLQPRLKEVFGFDIPVRLQPRYPKRLGETMLHMVELWQHREPIVQLKAQQAATEIVIAILEDHAPSAASVNWAMPEFEWITSYFSFHLSEPLSIEDMARRAHLSPSRFTLLFRQRYGQSPYQYLLAMRVHHAQDLLRTTSLSQEEIAAYCGFSDIHHFSKSFKKRTGLTPGAWRSAPDTE